VLGQGVDLRGSVVDPGMTASSIYATLTSTQKCELLDARDGGGAPAWGHELGILDADADYGGEETGFVDCSAPNTLGMEVTALCQIWYDGGREVIAKAQAAVTALVNVEPEARTLASEAKGMDWGDVSDYGCTVSHGIDAALAALRRL
jgi:hypothetical protein